MRPICLSFLLWHFAPILGRCRPQSLMNLLYMYTRIHASDRGCKSIGWPNDARHRTTPRYTFLSSIIERERIRKKSTYFHIFFFFFFFFPTSLQYSAVSKQKITYIFQALHLIIKKKGPCIYSYRSLRLCIDFFSDAKVEITVDLCRKNGILSHYNQH